MIKIIVAYLILTVLFYSYCIATAQPEDKVIGTASWYSKASCLKESGQFIMANGKELDDAKFTCASWDYKFGTILKITNLQNGKSILVKTTDRGPIKKLRQQGRIVDLSRAAFSAIADLKQGVIPVEVIPICTSNST